MKYMLTILFFYAGFMSSNVYAGDVKECKDKQYFAKFTLMAHKNGKPLNELYTLIEKGSKNVEEGKVIATLAYQVGDKNDEDFVDLFLESVYDDCISEG